VFSYEFTENLTNDIILTIVRPHLSNFEIAMRDKTSC